jgi:hypothetical protein
MDDPVSAVERTLQDVVALAAEAQALPHGAEQKLTTALLHDRDALREACVLLAHILVSSMDSQVGGAPTGNINFELCQACFTAVVRILTALGSADWAVEEVLGLLESVHEVYDVVLTCAETYEWAMPGATGPLRLYMLQVIAVCFGHERLTGRSLMELLSMDTTAAVSLLTYILRCRDPDCGFELQEVAARCLMELTTADAVFVPDEDDRTNDQQIAELTVSLNRHTNSMIQGIVQFDAVDAFGRCICQHQESHSRTDVLVKAFLGMIHNSLLYCSSNQKNLRSHLSIRSTIVQDIMIPYVENILPALYEAPQVTPQMIEFQNLAATMQTFVIVTFNLNLFRAQFLHTDILARCMEAPLLAAGAGSDPACSGAWEHCTQRTQHSEKLHKGLIANPKFGNAAQDARHSRKRIMLKTHYPQTLGSTARSDRCGDMDGPFRFRPRCSRSGCSRS